MFSICLRTALAALFLALLGACSPSSPSSQSNQAPAVNARAQQDLALYLEMRKQGKYELAAPIGAGVLKRAPGSKAATTIRKTLATTRKKAEVINEKRRVKRLWLYQTGEQSGGYQSTASLHPSRPVDYHGRVRLILRKHTDWGTSVYLYDSDDEGFVCQRECQLPLKVDGNKAEPLQASQPPTGEPALFIDSDQRILKLIKSAETLSIGVDVKGDGEQTLFFEVAGFDPERWVDAKVPEPKEPEAGESGE